MAIPDYHATFVLIVSYVWLTLMVILLNPSRIIESMICATTVTTVFVVRTVAQIRRSLGDNTMFVASDDQAITGLTY
jgi:hypothetical protein